MGGDGMCAPVCTREGAGRSVQPPPPPLFCVPQVLVGGQYHVVMTFEEAFSHHVDFMWMNADGLSARMHRKESFKDYVRGFEPRARFPQACSRRQRS